MDECPSLGGVQQTTYEATRVESRRDNDNNCMEISVEERESNLSRQYSDCKWGGDQEGDEFLFS